MPLNIKIFFMSADGSMISESPDTHTIPVIPVKVWPSHPDNLYTHDYEKEGTPAYALIDTGADNCYVDSDFSIEINLPAVKETIVSGATSTIKTNIVNSTIEFTGINERFGIELTSVPLIPNSRHYKIIFGMQLIKLGTLIMDSSKNKYELIFRN